MKAPVAGGNGEDAHNAYFKILRASAPGLLRMALAIIFCTGTAAAAQTPALEQQAGGQTGKRQQEQDQHGEINLHFFSSPKAMTRYRSASPCE